MAAILLFVFYVAPYMGILLLACSHLHVHIICSP